MVNSVNLASFEIEIRPQAESGSIVILVRPMSRRVGEQQTNAQTSTLAHSSPRRAADSPQGTVDRFWDAWSHGQLPLPFGAAATNSLYAGYRRWADEASSVPKPVSLTQFVSRIASQPSATRHRARLAGRRQVSVLLPRGKGDLPGVEEQIRRFEERLAAWLPKPSKSKQGGRA